MQNIEVKRNQLGGLIVWAKSALEDRAYEGSVVVANVLLSVSADPTWQPQAQGDAGNAGGKVTFDTPTGGSGE